MIYNFNLISIATNFILFLHPRDNFRTWIFVRLPRSDSPRGFSGSRFERGDYPPPKITGALDSVHWHWLSLRPAVTDILIFMF